MTTLWLDCETFSIIPISKGTHKYSEGVEVMLWAYAVDSDPISVWDITASKSMPEELAAAFYNGRTIIYAHNAHFDRTMLEKCGFHSDLSRWRCSMAQAYAHSLPGSLDSLCTVFKLGADTAKDKEGKKLVQLFCMPRKTGKVARATRETHPVEWKRFMEYARLDIASMREIVRKMPNWNYKDDELRLWHLDQTINNRGYQVDTELAASAVRASKRAQNQLADRTETLTFGDLGSTTQRDETLRHLVEAWGVDLPDLTAPTVARRIEDPELPAELKELLGIRLQASSTSVAKYRKLLDCVSADGRLRGTMQFCGAARTGRWGGRLFQPQNLLRPTLEYEDIMFGIECILGDCEDYFFENVMKLCANAVRGCIVATKGKKLCISDLASIEGRVLAWLAGEQSECDAYAKYDTFLLDKKGNPIPDGKGGFKRVGPDLYCVAYARAFHVDPWSVTKAQRQIGKVMVLMLGYAGGVGAFLTGAATYKIKLDEMAKAAYDTIPDDILKAAKRWWDASMRLKLTFGLDEKTFIVCDSLKRLWRRAHPCTVRFWSELYEAFYNATKYKGVNYQVGEHISIRRDGTWLRIVLPSGRSLCYVAPRILEIREVDEETGDVTVKETLTYLGQCPYTRKFRRLRTYGGKLAENITQAVARDVMTANMPEIEDAGYAILLTVHDEIISEAEDSRRFSAEDLSALLSMSPVWADGLPLAAGGFETYRYRKGD